MEHLPQLQQNPDLLPGSVRTLGCDLTKMQFEQLNCYVQELLKWNVKSNLTGFTNETGVIGNLVADSLAAYSLFKAEEPGSILDVGTGAGIPGIPLKIAFPSIKMTLVEPSQKKVAFLHHMVGTLALKNIHIETSRIEQIRADDKYHGIFDCVVIKALRLGDVLPYVGEFLSKNGKVICWRADTLNTFHELYGFRVISEISYYLPFELGHRILSILSR